MNHILESKGLECPNCHNTESFLNYSRKSAFRETGHPTVGRCFNKNCNYHVTPRMYSKIYIHHTIMTNDKWKGISDCIKKDSNFSVEVGQYWDKSPLLSNMVLFLDSMFQKKDVRDVIRKYKVTSPRFARDFNVFWQIDEDKNVIDGRILEYNNATGECLSYREEGEIAIISKMVNQSEEYMNYHRNVLFGQHLLTKKHTKPICIVEDEISALMGSIVVPNQLWLATCGQELSFDLFKSIIGQDVTLFPKNVNFDQWKVKAAKFGFALSSHVKNNLSKSEDNLATLFISLNKNIWTTSVIIIIQLSRCGI